jgi:pimeloyl-ACP methyl ester carboxylesterase
MGTALRTEPDRVDELRRTGLPILVAYGTDDDAWSTEVQREMASRLGAALEIIEGAAHSPTVEQPEATVAVLSGFWLGAGARGAAAS